MILTDRYAIGHIGRTGGDNCLIYFEAMGIKLDKSLGGMGNAAKHKTFDEAEVDVPYYGITFRRLPYREMSFRQCRFPKHTAQQMIELHESETALCAMIANRKISYVLRSEHLIEDVARFLWWFEGMDFEATRASLKAVRAKHFQGNNYPILDFFGRDGLRRLYDASPTWSRIEREVYGELLTDGV